jgi:hypothetical protein
MILLTATAMLLMQNWTAAGSEARGSYEYDPASVSRTGDVVRLRMRITLYADAPDGTRSVIMDVGIACSGRTMTTYAVTAYGSGGAALGSRNFGPGGAAPQAIPSNSIEDNIRQRLCS